MKIQIHGRGLANSDVEKTGKKYGMNIDPKESGVSFGFGASNYYSFETKDKKIALAFLEEVYELPKVTNIIIEKSNK